MKWVWYWLPWWEFGRPWWGIPCKVLGLVCLTAALLAAIAFATLFGLTDEIHQLWVPHRSFSLLDLLTDTVGATAGALTWLRSPFRPSWW